MANKKICDICGKECSDSGRYELIYKYLIRTSKEDICYKCMLIIKDMAKQHKRVDV